jgi:hypothetical protein
MPHLPNFDESKWLRGGVATDWSVKLESRSVLGGMSR